MSDASATSLQIALVIHSLRGGGAERLMSQLASRWARAGQGVHMITLAQAGTDDYPLDSGVIRHGLDLMRDSQSRLQGAIANVRRVRSLRSQLREIDPDFILSFCDRMNILTASATRAFKVPVWLAEHSDPRKQTLSKLWEAWRTHAYPHATGCVVLNEQIADWMRRRFPKLSVEVIPPAIARPTRFDRSEPTSSAVASSRSEQSPRLLAMGRHSPEKNMLGLLRAWKILANDFPQWKLVLAGDGPLHDELVRSSNDLGLSNRIEFTGWIDDPWSLLATCDCLVLPSFYEGFPVTLLEAMSMGLACVSTPSSDSVHALSQAGAVEVAHSAEPKDLAAAIGRLLGSRERRAELGRAGRVVAAKYDWAEIGPRWDRLLARAKPHAAVGR